MNRIIRLTLLIACVLSSLMMSAQAPLSIPRPNKENPNNFVSDPAGLLSSYTLQEINAEILNLKQSTTCEMAVAIVGSLDGLSKEDYAYQLFKHWGIGTKDKDNGVLFLICPNERKAKIEVGSGAEGVLTDAVCAGILRNYVRPAVKDDNISQGVYNAVRSICKVLENPAVAEELKSGRADTTLGRMEAIDSNVFMSFIFLMVICVFMFTLILFIVDFIATRRRDNYRRAMTWRTHLGTYWWGAALSLGAALPIALVAYLLYRRARDVKEICDTCGAKMQKLSEEADNEYLTPSQDFEEKLGTVDYDVWLCPECGTVERFPYIEKQLKYQKCPNCNTIAMNLVMDKVVEPPTTTRQGFGERLYQCQFCRHTKRESYHIPKKTDASAALAAGAILGGMASGSRGFGSGGGGSFGGGRSSGGGAGINW
ncbi:MAG: TPM domain-containing protein [Muribaculaceae bacterium]|nr:TPM domain-containing protein [Muribaculaceae bacterium]